MRPVVIVFAVVAFAALVLAVNTGGRILKESETIEFEQLPAEPDGDDMALAVDSIASDDDEDESAAGVEPSTPASHSGPTRAVAPSVVAPPPLQPEELERVAPREPLSEIALALPPKPVMPDDWEGTILYRPVAKGSALFEAMGRTIAISGTENLEPEDTCSFEGRDWACGIRARTALRAFIRGRAVVCAVPPDAERTIITADCRIGKQNVAAWLVENGWARPTEGSPYAEAGEKARAAKLGIYGPPPTASN